MKYFVVFLCALFISTVSASPLKPDGDKAQRQTTAALPIPLQYFGLHIHRADAGTAWPNVPFGSWRLWDAYVGWAQLEPKQGAWDFARLDRYVAIAKLTKVDILLPLAMTPNWASARPDEPSPYKPGNAAEPLRLDDWTNYVATVGLRYKGKITHFEVWNEPSDKSHYSGSIEALVRMACEAKRVLKGIDPSIQIVSPASAGGGKHIEYLDRFLAAGGKDCVDVVAHHFYVFKTSPETLVPLIRQVREVMKKNGVADKPLWNTETGWWIANGDGTPDHPMVAKGGWKKLALEKESGDYLERAFVLARAEGVERFYWYAWDNRYGLGMIEPTSGAPKPMVESWRKLVETLRGATQLQCFNKDRNWRCTFVRSDGTPDLLDWVAN
ncbi:glycosyl hydrolase [Rhodoferax sp.]|uniref:glycosyl hydrolase n=1 Tax=Rhodoferax sp. TaxID=50421 RepID=UPI0025CF2FE3|nr:glycosyl hydrolase [Rhodoferax sp.]